MSRRYHSQESTQELTQVKVIVILAAKMICKMTTARKVVHTRHHNKRNLIVQVMKVQTAIITC